jgi:hypothetical protein
MIERGRSCSPNLINKFIELDMEIVRLMRQLTNRIKNLIGFHLGSPSRILYT